MAYLGLCLWGKLPKVRKHGERYENVFMEMLTRDGDGDHVRGWSEAGVSTKGGV